MNIHRLPRRGSTSHTSLRRLHAIGGTATQAAWRQVAGFDLTEREFANRVVSPLVRHGLVADGVVYAITPAGRALIGEPLPAVDVAPAEIAQPRTVMPFKPLQRSSKSAIVYRDGAFDYRNSPSLMGGQRVPYRAPI